MEAAYPAGERAWDLLQPHRQDSQRLPPQAKITMSDEAPSAIRATRGPILKEYEDGSLAVRVLIAPPDKQTFMKLLPDVNLPIFIAAETIESARIGLQDQTIQTYGEFAQELRLHSDWMGNPKVWLAIGTDEQYLEWCRNQKCPHCSRAPEWEMDTLVLNEAAHVRRVANGAGTAIKPPYSAITLCSGCHREQHQYGEEAIGGKDKVDQLRLASVKRWAWERMRVIFGVESMREVDPVRVLAWAKERGIERHLPNSYRSAA
jgi:hypothetical protein